MPGDVVSDRLNELYRGEIFEPQLQRVCRDRIHWMCGQVIGNDVLDLGCSQGMASLLLGREGHHVMAVDTDPAAISYALSEIEKEADYVKRNVKCHLASGENLPFADAGFDTVLLGEILEHLTRPERVLREVHRLLRVSGRVVITTPFGVHPHPSHVRTFFLTDFLVMVGRFFGVHDIRVADNYICCVAVKRDADLAKDRNEAAEPASAMQVLGAPADQLLAISESAFMTKDQRHWESRDNLSKQVNTLRQNLDKSRLELDNARKAASESTRKLEHLETNLKNWNSISVSLVDRVREFLQKFNGKLSLGVLLDRTDLAMTKMQTGQPAEVVIGYLPDLMMESVRAGESRLKQVTTEHEAERAEMSRAHEQELAAQKSDHESRLGKLNQEQQAALAELRKVHEQELAKIRQEREQALAAQKSDHESRLGKLNQEQQAALAELRKIHEQELAKIRQELRQEREQALVAQNNAYQVKLAELATKHNADVAQLGSRWEQYGAELRNTHERDLIARQQAFETTLARLKEEHQTALAEAGRLQESESAKIRSDLNQQLLRQKQAYEEEIRRLRLELQKAGDTLIRTEQRAEQIRTRLNSLAEYYRRVEQLHFDEIRYQLGDALVRAVDSPRDLLRLPGRFMKLWATGRKRRREREQFDVSDTSTGPRAQQAAMDTPFSAPPAPSPVARPVGSSVVSTTVVPSVPKEISSTPHGPASTAIGVKPVEQVSSTFTVPGTSKPASPVPSAGQQPAAMVLDKAPFAPHLGMGGDPKETVFAKVPAGPRRRVGIVLDEFSRDCFVPEFESITFRPDNWANVLKVTGAELLLVESAWHGNDGSWQYRVASYQKNMGNELADLIACCRRNGVPTVFWNKEDPAHFDRFIERAGLFDIVLTTDADCIPRYRERLGHDRVYALPFAAQPLIHNPVQTEPRIPKACFAGTYYRNRHGQRREDMNIVLRPAMRLGLDIYDRMYGAVGAQKEQYAFPEEYQSAIRGRLGYGEMVAAYKHYRVFLNVNSVTSSPTMFSRRVFELLACGTPVVSTYAKGIETQLGPNGVFMVESEDDAAHALDLLLHDASAWSKASAQGINRVLTCHTYRHRFARICELAGVSVPAEVQPLLSVTVSVRQKTELDAVADSLADQSYRQFEVHLFTMCDLSASDVENFRRRIGGNAVTLWRMTAAQQDVFDDFLRKARGSLLCNIRSDWLYSSAYFADCVMFFMIPGVHILGKRCHFVAGLDGHVTVTAVDDEYRMLNMAPSGTIAVRKNSVTADMLDRILTESVFKIRDDAIFSTYRYNCLECPANMVRPRNDMWSLRLG